MILLINLAQLTQFEIILTTIWTVIAFIQEHLFIFSGTIQLDSLKVYKIS